MLRSIWACRFVPTRFPEPIALFDGREREGLRAKAHVDGLSRIRRWQCSRRSFFPLQACQRSGRKSWASKVRRHYIRRPFVDRAGSARAGGVLKDDADLSTLGLKDGMSLMLMVRTVLRRRRCPLSPHRWSAFVYRERRTRLRSRRRLKRQRRRCVISIRGPCFGPAHGRRIMSAAPSTGRSNFWKICPRTCK